MTPGPTPSFHAFTMVATGRANRIISKVFLGPAFDPASDPAPVFTPIEVDALWDTGATNSVITPATAAALNLPPTGVANISHAGGTGQAKTYVLSVTLPNQVRIAAVQVSECADNAGTFGAIIGMDVITMGDFAVTNADGKTCVSFRIPSVEKIDFVREAQRLKYAGVQRNAPCPCGSGKKFKKCHGA